MGDNVDIVEDPKVSSEFIDTVARELANLEINVRSLAENAILNLISASKKLAPDTEIVEINIGRTSGGGPSGTSKRARSISPTCRSSKLQSERCSSSKKSIQSIFGAPTFSSGSGPI